MDLLHGSVSALLARAYSSTCISSADETVPPPKKGVRPSPLLPRRTVRGASCCALHFAVEHAHAPRPSVRPPRNPHPPPLASPPQFLPRPPYPSNFTNDPPATSAASCRPFVPSQLDIVPPAYAADIDTVTVKPGAPSCTAVISRLASFSQRVPALSLYARFCNSGARCDDNGWTLTLNVNIASGWSESQT